MTFDDYTIDISPVIDIMKHMTPDTIEGSETPSYYTRSIHYATDLVKLTIQHHIVKDKSKSIFTVSSVNFPRLSFGGDEVDCHQWDALVSEFDGVWRRASIAKKASIMKQIKDFLYP